LAVMEYFPFLVNYMDAYGKENYDYLNKVTKVAWQNYILRAIHFLETHVNF